MTLGFIHHYFWRWGWAFYMLHGSPNKALHRKNQPPFRCAALRLFFR